MKTLKKSGSILSIIMLIICSLIMISCGDNDDNDDSLTDGYWIPQSALYDLAVETIQNDWMDDDGYMGGYRAYRFINNNTVEVFSVCIYGKFKNSFHQESILGKTIYYVAQDVSTYTYASKENKIFITNGDICTISGKEFRLDGDSNVYTKIK